MKSNRNTLMVCLIGFIITLIALFVMTYIFKKKSDFIFIQIIVGMMTGFLVAIIIAITSYYHYKNEFFNETYSNLILIYQNLLWLNNKVEEEINLVKQNLPFNRSDINMIEQYSNSIINFRRNIDIFKYNPLIFKNDSMKSQLLSLNLFLNGLYKIEKTSLALRFSLEKTKIIADNNQELEKNKNNYIDIEYEKLINNKKIELSIVVKETSRFLGKLESSSELYLKELESNIIDLCKIYKGELNWEEIKKNIDTLFNNSKLNNDF